MFWFWGLLTVNGRCSVHQSDTLWEDNALVSACFWRSVLCSSSQRREARTGYVQGRRSLRWRFLPASCPQTCVNPGWRTGWHQGLFCSFWSQLSSPRLYADSPSWRMRPAIFRIWHLLSNDVPFSNTARKAKVMMIIIFLSDKSMLYVQYVIHNFINSIVICFISNWMIYIMQSALIPQVKWCCVSCKCSHLLG